MEINRAQELDPLSLTIDNNVGRILFYSRRYDDAIRGDALNPFTSPDRILVPKFSWRKRRTTRKSTCIPKRLQSSIPSNRRATWGQGKHCTYAASGQTDVAKRVLREHAEVPSETGTLDYVFHCWCVCCTRR